MSLKLVFVLFSMCAIVIYFAIQRTVKLPNSYSKHLHNKLTRAAEVLSRHSSTETSKTPPDEREVLRRKVVIILAYMHTGSSFLGSIFQNHNGSFYQYENLRSLMYSTRAEKTIFFLDGTNKTLFKHPDNDNVHHNIDPFVGAEAVRNMVTCNHQNLDVATLANHYFGIHNVIYRDSRSYFTCQENMYGNSTSLHPKSALIYVDNKMLNNISRAIDIVKACLHHLSSKCSNSTLLVEKFIRMTMQMANLLLKQLKKLILVHLIRDPRAMLYSQIKHGDSGAWNSSVFEGRARYMCMQLKQDLNLSRHLKRVYPGQIYTLRYEDLIDNPIQKLKSLFDFIGIPFTRNDEDFIIMSSKANLVSWRKNIKDTTLQTVDRFCADLYRELGYIRITNITEERENSRDSHLRDFIIS